MIYFELADKGESHIDVVIHEDLKSVTLASGIDVGQGINKGPYLHMFYVVNNHLNDPYWTPRGVDELNGLKAHLIQISWRIY